MPIPFTRCNATRFHLWPSKYILTPTSENPTMEWRSATDEIDGPPHPVGSGFKARPKLPLEDLSRHQQSPVTLISE